LGRVVGNPFVAVVAGTTVPNPRNAVEAPNTGAAVVVAVVVVVVVVATTFVGCGLASGAVSPDAADPKVTLAKGFFWTGRVTTEPSAFRETLRRRRDWIVAASARTKTSGRCRASSSSASLSVRA
jgi:hypothetical protein